MSDDFWQSMTVPISSKELNELRRATGRRSRTMFKVRFHPYPPIQWNVVWIDRTHNEVVIRFTGSLLECEAWLRLFDKGYLDDAPNT